MSKLKASAKIISRKQGGNCIFEGHCEADNYALKFSAVHTFKHFFNNSAILWKVSLKVFRRLTPEIPA